MPAEFEEQTGIALEVRIVPSDLYFSNKIHHLLDGEDAADVYMSGPVLVWEHLAAGFVQPLDEFLERASESYEAADFVERLLACNRWSGRFGDPLGEGPLLEIPVNCESYNLAYVPAVLDAAGLEVPDDLGRVLRGGARGRRADRRPCRRVRPARHRRVAHDVHRLRDAVLVVRRLRFRGRPLRARGARRRSGRPSDFLAALRARRPADWLDQRWYELALDFARGRYALLVDSDHYVAYFEDPAHSELVGEIGYAPPPLGPTGSRRPNLWTWSVVMNTRAGTATPRGGSSSGRPAGSSCSARSSRAT